MYFAVCNSYRRRIFQHEEFRYVCDLCPQRFWSRQGKSQHLLTVHRCSHSGTLSDQEYAADVNASVSGNVVVIATYRIVLLYNRIVDQMTDGSDGSRSRRDRVPMRGPSKPSRSDKSSLHRQSYTRTRRPSVAIRRVLVQPDRARSPLVQAAKALECSTAMEVIGATHPCGTSTTFPWASHTLAHADGIADSHSGASPCFCESRRHR